MNIPAKLEKEFAAFPLVLCNLVRAEIATGNSIVEIGAGFPAPPVGANLTFAKPVSTRPRQSADGLSFRERNSSSYSGEFTDAQRFYFVLEPANTPEPDPDMDAIRMALETKPNAFAITDREKSAPADATARTPQRSANAASSDLAMTITEADSGDDPDIKIFADEAEFLNALRQFFAITITRNAGRNKPTDVDAWKLFLRLLKA